MKPHPKKEVSKSLASSEKIAFILKHTKRLSPALVPELHLYLAEESVPMWTKMEEVLGEQNVPPPFWAFAWPGGQALARYILDRPEEFKGRRVLDLGAGSGLTAIAAARAGAATVVAQDCDAFACAAIALNAEANAVMLETICTDTLKQKEQGVDVLLVGDLFYERPLAEKVLHLLQDASKNKIKILIGDPQRTYFPKDHFRCITQYDVPVSKDLEDSSLKRTAIWEMAD